MPVLTPNVIPSDERENNLSETPSSGEGSTSDDLEDLLGPNGLLVNSLGEHLERMLAASLLLNNNNPTSSFFSFLAPLASPVVSEDEPNCLDDERIKKSGAPLQTINAVQKNIVEGTFYFLFQEIDELPSVKEKLNALNAITKLIISLKEIEAFKQLDIWKSIVQARRTYFSEHAETKLNLSSRDDEHTKANRDGVRGYIEELIKREKEKVLTPTVRKIQFWYRRTRDENKALALIEEKDTPLYTKIQRKRN